MLYETLCNAVDPRSGAIQEKNSYDSSRRIVMDIMWKNGIHFIVTNAAGHENFGWYYAERNLQLISDIYHFGKVNDKIYKSMQQLIDDIEDGKYNNKKTLSERIVSAVRQKGLVSYMNNTKWHELINAVSLYIPDIPIQYKTIFEDDLPDGYFPLDRYEELEHINYAVIEYMQFRCIISDTVRVGQLIPPKVRTYDKSEDLLRIFKEYNIPYEFTEDQQIFTVYGYKNLSAQKKAVDN